MLNSVDVNTPDPDDQPFRHYSTKHRIVAWISQNLFDHFRYTVRSGPLKGMRRRGGFAWLPEAIMAPTRTPESYFWMKQNLKGMVIYDIGAYHGLLTMFFARQAKQVISFEPNSRNHARLSENLELNRLNNVMVRKTGVGAKTEVATMVASPSMMGGASIETETVAGLVKSHGPMLSEQIPITTLDEDVQKMSLPKPDFIKIDVEGQELAVLMGARNTLLTHHPILFLEMHGETMNLKRQKVAALVSHLNDLGYQDIEHVETGTKLNQANSAVAAEGHLYCTQPLRVPA